MNSRWTAVAVGLVLLAFVGYPVWQWEVERVEVPTGKFLIRIHKWGKDLAPDQIIAPDESYKGVMLTELAEGLRERLVRSPLIRSRRRRSRSAPTSDAR